jgi:two-component system, cell cycle sensor histidine kinase and response regulator CckA
LHPGLTDEHEIGAALFDSTIAGIFSFDRNGQVLRANDTMVNYLGSPDEKTTRQFNVLTLPTVPARIRSQYIQASLTDGKNRSFDLDYVSMHGVKRSMRFHLLPLVENGDVIGANCIALDVSEWKLVAERLRRTSKMQSLSLLSASLSHDLNNIFTTLLGFSSLLSQDRDMTIPKRDKALRHIRSAATSGANLVEQLLSFTSERRVHVSASEFRQAYDQSLTLFSYGIPSNVELRSTSTPPQAWVEGSTTKIEQILINVLLNARDAIGSETGSIDVHAGTVAEAPQDAVPEPSRPPQGFVHLAIKDTGCGIPSESLGRIFDPYFTTKETGRGTGLGLSSVWGILQELGGCIEVHSVQGKGTEVHLYLPISDSDGPAVDEEAPIVDTLEGDGQRILIVESDPELRDLLAWVLLKNGYKALAEPTYARGMELLEVLGDTVHGIVWDLSLGVAQLDAFLHQVTPLGIPVLYLSSSDPNPLSVSETTTLRKPFEPARFLDALSRMFKEGQYKTTPDCARD